MEVEQNAAIDQNFQRYLQMIEEAIQRNNLSNDENFNAADTMEKFQCIYNSLDLMGHELKRLLTEQATPGANGA